MRVLVCDDEPLAVGYLSNLLARFGDVEVVATATGGREAGLLITELDPQLVFLDVEMPEHDGFDVVEELARRGGATGDRDDQGAGEGETGLPLIVFVTAYPRFAPQDLNVGAIDYLTKPVRSARLETTLARARAALAQRESGRRLAELEGSLAELRRTPAPEPSRHVWVSNLGEVVRVDLDRVERVRAQGMCARLHMGESSFLHRETIAGIEAVLDGSRFLRVHRSHIVRTDLVASMRHRLFGQAELLLQRGERIPVGRKYVKQVRQRLNGPEPRR